jgi:hypothetical protein
VGRLEDVLEQLVGVQKQVSVSLETLSRDVHTNQRILWLTAISTAGVVASVGVAVWVYWGGLQKEAEFRIEQADVRKEQQEYAYKRSVVHRLLVERSQNDGGELAMFRVKGAVPFSDLHADFVRELSEDTHFNITPSEKNQQALRTILTDMLEGGLVSHILPDRYMLNVAQAQYYASANLVAQMTLLRENLKAGMLIEVRAEKQTADALINKVMKAYYPADRSGTPDDGLFSQRDIETLARAGLHELLSEGQLEFEAQSSSMLQARTWESPSIGDSVDVVRGELVRQTESTVFVGMGE